MGEQQGPHLRLCEALLAISILLGASILVILLLILALLVHVLLWLSRLLGSFWLLLVLGPLLVVILLSVTSLHLQLRGILSLPGGTGL